MHVQGVSLVGPLPPMMFVFPLSSSTAAVVLIVVVVVVVVAAVVRFRLAIFSRIYFSRFQPLNLLTQDRTIIECCVAKLCANGGG